MHMFLNISETRKKMQFTSTQLPVLRRNMKIYVSKQYENVI